MTQLNEYIAKQERFAKWLRNAFVAAGLPERLAASSICRHDSILTKRDIKSAIAVAAACGESLAGHVFTSLVLGRSAVHIRLMQDVVKNNRSALNCIVHHCPAAPVKAVLERLDFFAKLAKIAPQKESSLRLNVGHFPDLGPTALEAARRDWRVFRLALKIAKPGHLEAMLKNWSGLRRLQNILVQEPRLIDLMDGVLGDDLDARVRLCEMVLPSYQIFLRRLESSGGVLHVPLNEVMRQMGEIFAQNGVNPRLLGRLVEDFGLNGISYYVKAPNPNWLSDPDSYHELLKLVPESRIEEVLSLAVSVSERSKRKSFVRVFRELGSAGIVVTMAARAGHKIGAAEVAAIRYARQFGSEGTAFLENTPLERWVSEARLLKHRREGSADRTAYADCRQSNWSPRIGLNVMQLLKQARKDLGVVRLGRLRYIEERDPSFILRNLARSLRNFKHAPSLDRDVVVLVASRTDYNSAFRELYKQFNSFAATCHPVLIEGENLEEILTRITILRANHMHEGYMRPISGLCFLGHGNSSSIELSSSAVIDQHSKEILAEIGTHLAPGGEVFFEACLVGRRSEGADSLADIVAKALPHCRVYACPTIRASAQLSWVPEIGFVETGSIYQTTRIGPYQNILTD